MTIGRISRGSLPKTRYAAPSSRPHSADVYRSAVTNAAALGAALRAWHADTLADGAPRSWDAITAGLAEPPRDHRIAPDPQRRDVYEQLMPVYEAREAQALTRD